MAIQFEIKLSLVSPPVASRANTLSEVVYRSQSGPIHHRLKPVLAEELMTFNNNAEVYLSQINTNHTEFSISYLFTFNTCSSPL